MDEENYSENPKKKISNGGNTFDNNQFETAEIHNEPVVGDRHEEDIKMLKRTVTFGQTRPELGNNKIRTSKYTLFSFFPANLFEQLTKTANIYFLVIIEKLNSI